MKGDDLYEIFTKIRKSVNASSSMLANLWYFNGNRICTVSCNNAGFIIICVELHIAAYQVIKLSTDSAFYAE